MQPFLWSETMIQSFGSRLNNRDIEEYPERHFENRSDFISVPSVWRKEGSQRIDLSFNCWISLWLINAWYSESSILMESKRSLNWSEDPFSWLESVTWTKLDLVESYWIFDDIFCTFLKNRSLFTNHTLSNQIKFSLDTFLKKSDSCGFFPQLRKRSWRNCHIWNWAQFCKELARLFLEKRVRRAVYHYDKCQVEVQWCMQLTHPNRPVDLNLIPTWPNQFDQALAIYFHCSNLWQYEKSLFNSLTTWKNQKLCPLSLSIQGMDRYLTSEPNSF